MRDPELLDQPQILLRVEAFHDDRRTAHADRHAHRDLRRGVIKRCRRQVGHSFAVAPQVGQELLWRQRCRRRQIREVLDDSLRPAGGARRIEHHAPTPFVGHRGVGERRRRLQEISEATSLTRLEFPALVDNQQELHTRAAFECLLRHRKRRSGDNQRSGLAVVHDVGELVCCQVPVHGGAIQAGALTCAAALQIAGIVFHEHRVVIPVLQARRSEQMRQPVRPRLELGVCHGLTAAGHDETRLVSPLGRIPTRIHLPPSLSA